MVRLRHGLDDGCCLTFREIGERLGCTGERLMARWAGELAALPLPLQLSCHARPADHCPPCARLLCLPPPPGAYASSLYHQAQRRLEKEMRSSSESGASEAARQRKAAQEGAAGRADLLAALAG